jgi:anti-sigma factor RsiW
VRQDTLHPKDERLEAFSDGSLAGTELATIESHVRHCARCQAEVEDWRSLFAALSSLPALAPSRDFANRVMAHVAVRKAWYARTATAISRFVPRTTGGWVVAVAMLGVPVLAVGTLMVWLLSRSYLTGYRLWVFATDQFAAGTNQVASGALSRLMQTDVAVWIATNLTSYAESAGLRGMGVVAAGLACVIVVSIWVLYRYLFRTPNRGSTYVSFTF